MVDVTTFLITTRVFPQRTSYWQHEDFMHEPGILQLWPIIWECIQLPGLLIDNSGQLQDYAAIY
jgi:hypothetical protein